MSKNSMQKTMKLGNALPVKSRAVRCQECDRLVRIEKLPSDREKTAVQYMTCYDCMKNEKKLAVKENKKIGVKDYLKQEFAVKKPVQVKCRRCQNAFEIPHANYTPGRIYLCTGCQIEIQKKAALKQISS